MKRVSKSILICIFLMSALLNAKDNIYFPFFELISVHHDYYYSTAKLLKDYIEEKNRYNLILPPKPDSNYKYPSEEEVKIKAADLNCKYYLTGSLNRIGENVIVNIIMKETSSGNDIWRDRLKASSPEDLDPILQRIASAIGTEKKAAENNSIYSVTQNEANPLQQKQTRNSFGVSLGGVQFLTNPAGGSSFTSGGGVFWVYDARTIQFQLSGDVYFLGSDNNVTDATIGVLYPLSPDDNSFFFGGEAGIAYVNNENHSNNNYVSFDGSGLLLGLNAGYLIGRTNSVSLRIHAKYHLGLMSITQSSYSSNGSNLKGADMVSMIRFNLEIYFGGR
jgi:TolB-like protein